MFFDLNRHKKALIIVLVLLMHLGIVLAQNNSPLCFTARNGSVTVRFVIQAAVPTIQYSTDSVNWSAYNSNTDVLLDANQSVYFRAETNQVTALPFGPSSSISYFSFASDNGGTIEGSGNIMSLYGPDCPNLQLPERAFSHLFYNCSLLTSAPELPAMSLASYCYNNMFKGCTLLVTAPSLPATTLADYCYYGMFDGCSLLVNAPSLPATVMCNYCYGDMFRDCVSLVAAPALPAMNLSSSSNCYSGMFSGCSSLVTASILPATTLGWYCYSSMFMGCISLTTTPELPATTLTNGCYSNMFSGCSSLNNVPATLPALTLTHSCYHSMFKNCTSLKYIPTLPATNLADYCYGSMFENCNSLKINTVPPGKQWQIPSNASASGISDWNTNMFYGIQGTIYKTPTIGRSYYIDNWIIMVLSNDTLFGTVTGNGNYHYGEITTMVAINKEHYHFVQWSDGNTANPRTITVVGDTTLTAIFEIDKHIITASGTNGKVVGGGTFDYDSTIYLTAIPDDHYYFAGWSDGDTTNPRIITVSQDTSYTALFEGDIHTIVGGGNNGTVSGGGSYHYGSTATLTASADDHYHFVCWSDGMTSNSRTDTVRGDTAYIAIFEIDKHTVSASGDNGTVYGTGVFDYGTTDTLIARGNDHYHFVRWSDGDTANPKIITVTDDITFTATFEIDKHTIIVNGSNGTVTGGGTYDYGTSVILTAEADEHYHFIGWSDGVATDQRTVIVSRDTTYTAIFEIDKHIVSDSCVNGSIIGVGEYDYCSTVTISTLPDEHYSFVSWQDGNTSETRSFVLTRDTVVTALFDLTPYTISATCENGAVTGNGVYRYPDVVTLAVEPDEGYMFVEWDDGNEYNPRIFVAEENITIEAICQPVPAVGVDDVKEEASHFYLVGYTVYNPYNELIRVYSAGGKLIRESNENIEMEGWPAGVYVVVDEGGNSMKVITNHKY